MKVDKMYKLNKPSFNGHKYFKVSVAYDGYTCKWFENKGDNKCIYHEHHKNLSAIDRYIKQCQGDLCVPIKQTYVV